MSPAGAAPVTVADLRPVDLFDDLDDTAARRVGGGRRVARRRGRGCRPRARTPSPRGFCACSRGLCRCSVHDGDRLEPVGHQTAPTWIGAVPALTETPVNVRHGRGDPVRGAADSGAGVPEARARTPVGAPPDHAPGQAADEPDHRDRAEPRAARLTGHDGRRARARAEQPGGGGAAVGRAAGRGAGRDRTRRSRAFVDAGLEREGAARIADLREQALRQASERSALSALDAADAEDEMRDRLEALGIADAWRLAEPLAIAGVDDDWLAQMQAAAGPATPAALSSLAAAIAAHSLVSELRESTDRMSSLVGAVKAYAYMDRGGVVEADIHEGLETTLTVLGHKLKHTQIEIKRDYDRALPPAHIYGSELNQVWTNLLDNAIDAVGESGTITVSTQPRRRLHPRRRSPTQDRGSRRTPARTCSIRSSPPRTSGAGRASGWTPPGGSSRTATAGR